MKSAGRRIFLGGLMVMMLWISNCSKKPPIAPRMPIMGRGMTFQARALQPVEVLATDGGKMLEVCRHDPEFGFTLMRRLLLIVSERLDATRLQLMDTYSPMAARAGA